MIKISVNMDISVLEFYIYILDILVKYRSIFDINIDKTEIIQNLYK